MTHYIAILVPADDGKWRALLPDVPECDTQAYGLTQVKKVAADSLDRHARSNGFRLPAPRSLEEIERDEEWLIRNGVDFSRAVVTIVPWPCDPFVGALRSA